MASGNAHTTISSEVRRFWSILESSSILLLGTRHNGPSLAPFEGGRVTGISPGNMKVTFPAHILVGAVKTATSPFLAARIMILSCQGRALSVWVPDEQNSQAHLL